MQPIKFAYTAVRLSISALYPLSDADIPRDHSYLSRYQKRVIAHAGAGFVRGHLVEQRFPFFEFFVIDRIYNARGQEEIHTYIFDFRKAVRRGYSLDFFRHRVEKKARD